MLERLRFLIDGAWVDPHVPSLHEVVDPATGRAFARISHGSAADVDDAVAAARRAFATYSRTTVEDRLHLLRKLLEVYRTRAEEMARTITRELGAPITMSREQQTTAGTEHIASFVEALQALPFERKLPNGDTVLREPIGVVGLITPWNWPMNQVTLKVVPALATGCTCVLKPSEVTPLSAMLFADMVVEAGFPAGVFNLVNGDGPGVGSAISGHPDIDMVSFTGSTRAGIAITRNAAETVKRVTLELGGKSPNLIFADADLEPALDRAIAGCMNNSGQSCDAPTRLLVENSILNGVLERLPTKMEAVALGDPNEEGDHIGPLVSEQHWRRVQNLIEQAVAAGTTLLAGGPGRPAGMSNGYYCRPTLFHVQDNEPMIARTEVFGPVLTVMGFETEEEAIRLANDTPYGLAAYVESNDPERSARVARALRAGMIHINGGPFRSGSPFGGYRMSGNGREGGTHGLEDFLELKTLHNPD